MKIITFVMIRFVASESDPLVVETGTHTVLMSDIRYKNRGGIKPNPVRVARGDADGRYPEANGWVLSDMTVASVSAERVKEELSADAEGGIEP